MMRGQNQGLKLASISSLISSLKNLAGVKIILKIINKNERARHGAEYLTIISLNPQNNLPGRSVTPALQIRELMLTMLLTYTELPRDRSKNQIHTHLPTEASSLTNSYLIHPVTGDLTFGE